MGYLDHREKEMEKVKDEPAKMIESWEWIKSNEPFRVHQFWRDCPYTDNFQMLACLDVLDEAGKIEAIHEEGATQYFVYQTTQT